MTNDQSLLALSAMLVFIIILHILSYPLHDFIGESVKLGQNEMVNNHWLYDLPKVLPVQICQIFLQRLLTKQNMLV